MSRAPDVPRPSACVVPLVARAGAAPRLLWARRADDATFLPGVHVVPGGVVDEADRDAPRTGGGDVEAARVSALRELFEEVGILVAEGAESLDRGAREELRRRFRESVSEGHEGMRALGLAWETASLIPTGRWVTPSFAPKRFDTQFYAWLAPDPIEPDPELLELEEAEWVEASDALARWGRAEVLIAPPLAALLRSLHRHGELRPDELRAVFGARGEETQRWEVAPWVQVLPLRTPTLPPATHTNAVLIGSGEAVLIEPATPYADELERAVAWVEEVRRDGIEVKALLVTHHHPDHVGGAKALAERLHVPIWGHRLTADRLGADLPLERLIEDGESIRLEGPESIVIRAMHTPGHAPGHLCFLEERSRVMVAGDMVASIGTILIEPRDGDMSAYLRSLERMDAERPSLLIPAHGAPIRDPHATLVRYVEHRLERERRVLSALASHARPASAMDLVPVAYADAPAAVWPLAALSTEAHLLKLAVEGRARSTTEGWVATQSSE